MLIKSLNYLLTQKSFTIEYSAKVELKAMTDNFTFSNFHKYMKLFYKLNLF